jgi:hypothetical protein
MTPHDNATIERHSGPGHQVRRFGHLRGIDTIKRNGDTVVVSS